MRRIVYRSERLMSFTNSLKIGVRHGSTLGLIVLPVSPCAAGDSRKRTQSISVSMGTEPASSFSLVKA